jgi:hypothetical protein
MFWASGREAVPSARPTSQARDRPQLVHGAIVEGVSDAAEADIDEIVSSAPEVELLDKAGLKRLIVSFERKMNQNQVHRMKFADQPSKCARWPRCVGEPSRGVLHGCAVRFMESEVELAEEINKLQPIAAVPELYPELIRLNAIPSIIGQSRRGSPARLGLFSVSVCRAPSAREHGYFDCRRKPAARGAMHTCHATTPATSALAYICATAVRR